MVGDPGLVIEKAQVGRYSSANRRSTSCSILLREGAITVEAKASSRKARESRLYGGRFNDEMPETSPLLAFIYSARSRGVRPRLHR